MLVAIINVGTQKCKTPAETRSKITEVDRMANLVAEVTGEAVGDAHWKSVLVGMLDPETRRHTVSEQGMDSSYEALKDAGAPTSSSVSNHILLVKRKERYSQVCKHMLAGQ